MSLLVSLYAAILFFVLVPGVLLSIPRKGSKLVVAAVHALVFGLIYHFTHKLVWRLGVSLEGFEAPEVSAPKESMKENMEEEKEEKGE
jgi:hypothetical protein